VPYYEFWWDERVLEKLLDNGVSPDDAESVICDPVRIEPSRSSGRPMAFGLASDGRMIACVYEPIDELVVRPVTAYYLEPR
jgi:uncharacterized DUF497 family protein